MIKNKLTKIEILHIVTILYIIVILTLNHVFSKWFSTNTRWGVFAVMCIFMVQRSVLIYMNTNETYLGDEAIWKKYWHLVPTAICVDALFVVLDVVERYDFTTNENRLQRACAIPLVFAMYCIITYYLEERGGTNTVELKDWRVEQYYNSRKYVVLVGNNDGQYHSFKLRRIDAYTLSSKRGTISVTYYNKTDRVVSIVTSDN